MLLWHARLSTCLLPTSLPRSWAEENGEITKWRKLKSLYKVLRVMSWCYNLSWVMSECVSFLFHAFVFTHKSMREQSRSVLCCLLWEPGGVTMSLLHHHGMPKFISLWASKHKLQKYKPLLYVEILNRPLLNLINRLVWGWKYPAGIIVRWLNFPK